MGMSLTFSLMCPEEVAKVHQIVNDTLKLPAIAPAPVKEKFQHMNTMPLTLPAPVPCKITSPKMQKYQMKTINLFPMKPTSKNLQQWMTLT